MSPTKYLIKNQAKDGTLYHGATGFVEYTLNSGTPWFIQRSNKWGVRKPWINGGANAWFAGIDDEVKCPPETIWTQGYEVKLACIGPAFTTTAPAMTATRTVPVTTEPTGTHACAHGYTKIYENM